MERHTESLDEGKVTFSEKGVEAKDRPCADVMKTDVEWIAEDTPIMEAAQRMKAAHVGFLPVCTPERKVVGTLTDRDIVIRAVAEGRVPESTRVSEVMTRNVVWCRPEDPIARAEELMAEHQVSRIVLLGSDETLRGVISLSDIAELDTASRAAATLREITARETSTIP